MPTDMLTHENNIRGDLESVDLIYPTAEMIPALSRVKEILEQVDSQRFSSNFILDMDRLLKDKVDAHHESILNDMSPLPQNSQAGLSFLQSFRMLKTLFDFISGKFEGYAEKVRSDWWESHQQARAPYLRVD